MAYLTPFISLPLTLFALSFAISNDADVAVGLWPMDEKYTLSLWQFGLGLLGGGFLLGALFVWLLSQKTRFLLWQESRRAARLEKELDALNAKKAQTETPVHPALPAK
jgi:uncharacterized membrane protein YdbT with pleckstrin-like domain